MPRADANICTAIGMKAQTARGANFTSGSILQRGKNMIPLLVPLFVSAFRRADELATAMEARCYRGGEGRTRMNELSYTYRDGIAMKEAARLIDSGKAMQKMDEFLRMSQQLSAIERSRVAEFL